MSEPFFSSLLGAGRPAARTRKGSEALSVGSEHGVPLGGKVVAMAAQRASAARESRLGRFPSPYLERLIESSPDIVVAVDRSGTVILYNDGAEKILGHTASEMLGQSVARLY